MHIVFYMWGAVTFYIVLHTTHIHKANGVVPHLWCVASLKVTLFECVANCSRDLLHSLGIDVTNILIQ